MKIIINTIVIITLILCFAQCKKGSTPGVSTEKDPESGKYIIRSKYFCNGGCFVFRSISNYETITWEWMTKETLESIKEDTDPYNSYVWNITRTGTIGAGIYIYADSSSADGISEQLLNPLAYYAIYQQKPDGFFNYLPQHVLSYDYTEDEAETGGPSAYVSMISTDISPAGNTFDHNLARVFIRRVTDSTRRITLMNNGAWCTYFSLLVDPDGSDCDDLQNIDLRPAWRKTWLCPHSSSIGNAWKVDACFTSQLVFEKID